MYTIQNLTNRKIIFQGFTIQPYSSVSVDSVHDFVTLSKFINAGKLSYTAQKKTEQKQVVQETPVVAEVIAEPEKVEVPETVITEEVAPKVESKLKEETVEDTNTFEEKDSTKNTGRKGKKKFSGKLD